VVPDKIIELNGKDKTVTMAVNESYHTADLEYETSGAKTIVINMTPNDTLNFITALQRAHDRAVERYPKPIIMRW
jgi:hypothetical protein